MPALDVYVSDVTVGAVVSIVMELVDADERLLDASTA